MEPAALVTPLAHLGRYAIDAELGRGAMGMVFKAHDPLIERTVAIKTIACGGLSRDEVETFERRFFREARSAGRLNHPNIVTIYDVGREGGLAYIAMEYLEGRTLRDALDSAIVLGADRIASIAAQVADGLAFAHANGVVHRDIKPANLMLLDNDIVKIADFGVALLPTGSVTQDGIVIGSPKYMSPEQVTGQSVDGRSDIFSLGAVLFEMLTGSPPFSGDDLGAILHQVINTTPAAPSSSNTSVDPGFDIIVARAMAKNPDERYPSAVELAIDLRRYRDLTPAKVESGTAEPPAASQPKPPRRWSWGWTAAVLATMAVSAVALKVRHQTEARLATNAVVAQKLGEGATAKTVVPAKPPAAPPVATPVATPAAPPTRPVQAQAPRSRARAAAKARLEISVYPLGEVYVDNHRKGVSPPLREISLTPGPHVIEIRNRHYPSHKETVVLTIRKSVRINYAFKSPEKVWPHGQTP